MRTCSLLLGSSGIDDLLLEVSWLGETNSDFLGGQFVIAMGDGIDLALHDDLV